MDESLKFIYLEISQGAVGGSAPLNYSDFHRFLRKLSNKMKNFSAMVVALVVLALILQVSARQYRIHPHPQYMDYDSGKLAKRGGAEENAIGDQVDLANDQVDLANDQVDLANDQVDQFGSEIPNHNEVDVADQIDEDDKPKFSWNQMKLILEMFISVSDK
ncbi:unnamed protein product [Owenia fusiformis]|uniref:Uncharacterized protein n=1 Tax=Owenia fusiformis TaxID=6347 RepID=A0A8S4PD54_OWEFU|nr:unnamed protein product [Owenia fusiformis]